MSPSVTDIEIVAANDASLDYLERHPRLKITVSGSRHADILGWIRVCLEAAAKARAEAS